MPCVENFRFLHICHVETSEISPHVIHGKPKILHMTIFFPLIILVILVTNIRSNADDDHVNDDDDDDCGNVDDEDDHGNDYVKQKMMNLASVIIVSWFMVQ